MLGDALADPSLRSLVEEAVHRVVRDVVREVAWEGDLRLDILYQVNLVRGSGQ